MLEKIKKFKWGYILLSAMLILSGVSFFVFRDADSANPVKKIAIAIGVLLLIYSVIIVVAALASKGRGFRFALNIIISVCALIAGLTIVISPEGAEVWIISVFGLLMIIDGSFKLQTSVISKRYKLWLWWVMTVLSVVTIAGGFICTNTVGLGSNALSIILGATLTVDGISNFLSAFYISMYEKRMKAEYSVGTENETKKNEIAENREEEQNVQNN